MEFKKQEQDAMERSKGLLKKANRDFKREFGRGYGDGLIDTYNMQGAKTALVAMGTICSTARHVIDGLKKKGMKVGLIRIKSFRPFPVNELRTAVKNIRTLQVIDRDISLGFEGALATDVKAALFPNKKIKVNGFIAGLGGRDVRPQDIEQAIKAKDIESEWINTQ
jgi:pyruvate ferredoxin oxidoreductase alpha subunit